MQLAVNITVLSAIYALIACGYVLIYRVSRVLNLAHGELMMLGAYLLLATATSFANSPVGTVAVLWVAMTSLLLPLVVAYKIWRVKGIKPDGRALWVDGAFAVVCLVLFVVTILFSFKRYAMF